MRVPVQEAAVLEQGIGAALSLFEAWVYLNPKGSPRPPGEVKDMPGRRDVLVGVLLYSDGSLVKLSQLLGPDRDPDGPLEEIDVSATSGTKMVGRLVPDHRRAPTVH